LVSVRDEADQARYVVEKVLANREAGLTLKSQAIVFRASHHSGQLEVELTRRNIPFVKYGGLKFLEAAHIKDVLAFLRWSENLRDRVAGFRIIQLVPGVGPVTAARILDRVAEQSDPMRGLGEFTPPAATAGSWPSFLTSVNLVYGRSAGWPAELDLISAGMSHILSVSTRMPRFAKTI
jgi:DNA helicase-2/ATP-dependent DNA helicase PcrA